MFPEAEKQISISFQPATWMIKVLRLNRVISVSIFVPISPAKWLPGWREESIWVLHILCRTIRFLLTPKPVMWLLQDVPCRDFIRFMKWIPTVVTNWMRMETAFMTSALIVLPVRWQTGICRLLCLWINQNEWKMKSPVVLSWKLRLLRDWNSRLVSTLTWLIIIRWIIRTPN